MSSQVTAVEALVEARSLTHAARLAGVHLGDLRQQDRQREIHRRRRLLSEAADVRESAETVWDGKYYAQERRKKTKEAAATKPASVVRQMEQADEIELQAWGETMLDDLLPHQRTQTPKTPGSEGGETSSG